MIAPPIEEAEAINWDEQRFSLEKDEDTKAIMANAQKRGIQALRHKPENPAPQVAR